MHERGYTDQYLLDGEREFSFSCQKTLAERPKGESQLSDRGRTTQTKPSGAGKEINKPAAKRERGGGCPTRVGCIRIRREAADLPGD